MFRALTIVVLALLLGSACRARDADEHAGSNAGDSGSQQADTFVAISTDSQVALDRREDSVVHAQVYRRIDSVAPFIIALEDSLASFPAHPHRAAWLWQLGELWSKNLAGYACAAMGPQPALGVKYAQYFDKHCCACELNYDYTHWKTLIAEFPNDPRAGDAAYGFTNREWGGECEGQVSCWINRSFGPLNDFLRRYPNSSHAAEAVERANDAFTVPLTFRPEENELFELYDADVVALIARYDSVAAGLPSPLRARAYRVIGPLWTMFGNDARAAELYRLSVSESGQGEDTAVLRRTWDSLVAKLKAPRPPPPPPDPV